MAPRVNDVYCSTNRYSGDEDLWHVDSVNPDGTFVLAEVAPYLGLPITFVVQPDNTAVDGAPDDRFVVEFRPWTPSKE